MRALLLLPLQRLILSIRLRITEHLFQQQERAHKKTLRISLCVWCVCAWALFMYGELLTIVWINWLDYTDTSLYPSLMTLGWCIAYVFMIIWINSWLISLRWSWQKIWWWWLFLKEAILRTVLIAWGYIVLGNVSITPIITYYLLVAASEEWVKWLSSLWIYKHFAFSRTDLILFALLVSLWFAFLENIIYMLQRTETIQRIWWQLSGWSIVLVSRWLIWFLVHMLFTWTIAYLTTYSLQIKKTARLIGALVLGISLHMSYNVLLYYNITIIVGIYLLLGYFWLSWLFWKSDSLYLSS